MDLDLSGMVALVTGSTKGIGHATALGLVRMGASVIVNGRTEDAVGEAIDKIKRAVPTARTQAAACDLAPPTAVNHSSSAFLPSTSWSTTSASTSRRRSSTSRTRIGRGCSRSMS